MYQMILDRVCKGLYSFVLFFYSKILITNEKDQAQAENYSFPVIFQRDSFINGYSDTQRTPNLYLREQGRCPQKSQRLS